MKKFLINLLTYACCTFTLFISNVTFAEMRLVNAPIDMLKSDKFLIKYRVKPLLNKLRQQIVNQQHAVKNKDSATLNKIKKIYNGDITTYMTLIKDGNNTLLIADEYDKDVITSSASYLYMDGQSYYWQSEGKVSSVEPGYKPNTNKIIKDFKNSEISKTNFAKGYSNLVNQYTDYNRLIFIKSGEQNIGGDISVRRV